ncbi:MAG: nucleoside deaminase [Paludibacteraceae bacterium]|nr:nucleoside deaminase [Paludibacteraceae bacterium]
MEKTDLKFMRKAIAISKKSVENGGGPFGAVIVKDGVVVASSNNQVTKNNDPTAHAEVMAIRKACKKLNTFDLSGCVLYASCEPCPMCLSAMYWAHIDRYFYANQKEDAKSIGFDDQFIYEELDKPVSKRFMPREQILRDEAMEVFRMWTEKEDKIEY